MNKCICAAVAALAARAASAQTVKLLDVPDASTKHVLASPASVRELPDGSVLVNDTERRQILMLARDLGEPRIIADSAGGLANSYGPRPGGLIPYVGDSTLFVDPVGLSMFVLAPNGSIARVASIPRSQDASQLAATGGMAPGIDAQGRLLYRGPIRIPTLARIGTTSGATPDSLEITRLDIKSRRLDTAAFYKTFKMSVSATQTEKGLTATAVLDPIQMVDDWAVLSNGTLAIVRGLDYHVDLIDANGHVTRGPKVPFTWRPLDDDQKVALLDSVRTSMSRAPLPGQPAGAMPMGGGHAMMMQHGDAGMAMTMTLAPASELPDYFPAFEQNASKADADGNLWVRTTATRAGAVAGSMYDVIDGDGVLVEHVQLPAGRRLLGFGRGGVVYLVARDQSGAWIERSHRPR